MMKRRVSSTAGPSNSPSFTPLQDDFATEVWASKSSTADTHGGNRTNHFSGVDSSEPEIPTKRSFLQSIKQQELRGWQPVYSTKSYPCFLLAAAVIIPIGILLLLVAAQLEEKKLEYTTCHSIDSPNETCADVIREIDGWKKHCRCQQKFTLEKDFEEQVYVYYQLTNFHQNHRLYVKSKDDKQLTGDIGSVDQPKAPSSDCSPLDTDSQGKYIFPCGAIANSMFNDTISIEKVQKDGSKIQVPLIRTGIAWETDKRYKFKNPAQFNNRDDPIWKYFTSPTGWGGRTIWDLDTENHENNGVQNEGTIYLIHCCILKLEKAMRKLIDFDFIVWMRTAALANFRKPYRIIDHSHSDFKYGLPAGEYLLNINYSFEVSSFGGTKSIVVATTSSFMGGRNIDIGIAYVTIGGILVLAGVILLMITKMMKNEDIYPMISGFRAP